ncbi:glucokinase, partial [Streptococcus suis]
KSVKLSILDVLGYIEAQWSIPTDISDNGKKIVSEIISSIQEYLLENSLSLCYINVIGMGSPGKIDFEKVTLTGAYNL